MTKDKNQLDEVSKAVNECYLQCLAVECGEGECARAIRTKFPHIIKKYKEE